MPELDGFHVSIYSDGEKLEEYSIGVSSDGKKISCWVPSHSGKTFVVKCSDGEHSLVAGKAKMVTLFVDGREVAACSFLPDDTEGEVDGVVIANDAYRPFVFAEVKTTDEDTGLGDGSAKPDEIGTISALLFLAESWEECNVDSSDDYDIQDCPPAVVNEREKKAGEHCVSLGDEEPCAISTWCNMKYDSKKPDLVFEFKYRSTAMLQAQGKIPSPESKTSIIIDLKDEDDEPPPKRRKVKHYEDRILCLQAKNKRLQKRLDRLEGKKAGLSCVKNEAAAKHVLAEIIDLT